MIATKLAVDSRRKLAAAPCATPPSQLAATHATMSTMTSPDKATWLRRIDRAADAHEKTRKALEDLVADARAAGVPLVGIAKHTPWSREWCRKIADKIDAKRLAEQQKPTPDA